MEIFIYLLKVSACSALFFAFYLLVLRKLTFFKINRFYLLLSLLISFIIPAVQFTIERESPVSSQIVLTQPLPLTQDTGDDIPLTSITIDSIQTTATGSFNWLELLPIIYGLIVLGLLALTIVRLFRLLKHTNSPIREINGLKVVAKEIGFTNCSFFNYVFIDENSLTEHELAVLLAHESVHVKQYHSVDKLFLIIVKAFLWFNPIIYLYNSALEETHEYEADEATSRSIGTQSYATLLLNLAVSRSQNPLIHNFVKSPVKQRIKMLFNSKSKKMKKLVYLIALPIGLGLIWGFTVKVTHRIKSLDYQETQLQDTLSGKTLKGKVIGFEKSKMGEVVNLQVGSKILPIVCYNFKDKIKIGEEISVSLDGKSFLPPPPKMSTATSDAKGNKSTSTEDAPYMVSKVIAGNGKVIYTQPQYAFLYEVNRARFASSTIKSIEKNSNGIITKIVLYDKGFTINLNVADQQFRSNDFKAGDSILVKFIGEKLTGAKTYTTDRMIAFYSQPKKYELINKSLYSKFYYENGKQKVYNKQGHPKIGQLLPKPTINTVAIKIYPKPIVYNASSARVNNTTKISVLMDVTMSLFNGILEAKEAEIDRNTKIITAKNATFKTETGKVEKGEQNLFKVSKPYLNYSPG